MNNKVLASVEKNNSIYTTTKNWIIAWSLLFAICTSPAKAKAAEISFNCSAYPIVENVEQQTTPDYMSQVEAGVKKYYPQYAEYFKTTIELINTVPTNIKNKINYLIHDNLDLFEDDITTEKDKITTILMFYETYF
jgi:hypothetical protein